MKIDNCIRDSIELVKEFMKERAYYFILRDKFITTRNKIFHVFQTIMGYAITEKCRIRFLQEAWHYTIDAMCLEKKNKKKVDKLKMLPDSVRDEFLSEYYKRAKINHRLKVYLSMNETKGVIISEKDPIRVDLKNKIKAIEKKLGIKKDVKKGKEPVKPTQAAAASGKGTTKAGNNKDLSPFKGQGGIGIANSSTHPKGLGN